MQVLEGTLERIVFQNEENSWTVARIREDRTERIRTVVGKLPGVHVGESIRIEGELIQNAKYGEQIQVKSYEIRAPHSEGGIEKYLASGMIQGVGPEMARRIVERFGEETLEIIDHHPERLLRVEGIGAKRLKMIRAAWQEQRGVRETMVFLSDLPIGSAIATRILQTYKERTIEIVRSDPYRLAEDVFLVGFQTADRIAQALGIEPESGRRAEAGVLHLLSRMSQQGHCCYPRPELVTRAAEFLAVDEQIVDDAVDRLRESQSLTQEELFPDMEAVYRAEMALAERETAEMICELRDAPNPPSAIDSWDALGWAEEELGLALGNMQKEAVEAAIESRVCIITGGPGTGKTTLVRSLLAILRRTGDEVLLAAPTGRAAKKMEEATGQPARTIHRLLEFDPRTGAFQRNEANPLTASTVILDEVSMVDIQLMHAFLLAVAPYTRVVLVGDVDQLPSVGPGNVLRDLIQSDQVRTVRLTEIYRQARESQIIVNAHRINRGEMPNLRADRGDFLFIRVDSPDQALDKIKRLMASEIQNGYGIDARRDVQVLAPMNKGIVGVRNLNRELQRLLNPMGPETRRDEKVLRLRDRVMQLRNNYDKDVYNGDMGRIVEIDSERSIVQVQFSGFRAVEYPFHQLDEITLSYAVSVHKSQGSEYRGVIVPLLSEHFPMLQRNLLYTAITRGRELVIVLGTEKTLAMAVRNDRIARRYSFLGERLRLQNSTKAPS
ncbi:MAG: ATP-dependent RecD-like DNA helicase [Gemmatimonadetes bacterium]|nr:ATP-dependent RecD-like DNA helicase [Gemmatimonadota bacterium]